MRTSFPEPPQDGRNADAHAALVAVFELVARLSDAGCSDKDIATALLSAATDAFAFVFTEGGTQPMPEHLAEGLADVFAEGLTAAADSQVVNPTRLDA